MRKIDPFHYGRIEKDEVNQQAFENYFQLIDEAERFYNDQIRRVVKSMSTGKDKTDVICLSGPSASGKTTTAHTLASDEAERFYNDQIRRVVKSMSTGKDKTDVICLSGPSASGKTTTAHTLARHFISSGRRAMVISLDDFYLDTDKTPLNRKGKPDFETIYSLDIERINLCIDELVNKGRTLMPIFDFHSRKKTPLNRKGKPDFETIYSLDIERINLCIDELVNKGRTLMPIFDFHSRKRVEGQEKEIAISGDDVVIIEGLHGLNPLLTQRVGEDKVTRIFASVRSRFTDHDRVLLTPQDVRLMRRMVRDRSTRNTTPEQTMAMWDEVCEGESEYINPYRDSADFKLDTTLDYEPNIFHSYLLPFLENRSGIAPECEGESEYINPYRDSADFKLDTTLDYEPNIFHSYLLPFLENRSGIAPEHYRKLDELYQRLDEFFDINNTQAIPADSVVREFIGPRRESEQTE